MADTPALSEATRRYLATGHVTITGQQRCCDCGRFIAYSDLPDCKLHFEPLNEFGPEIVQWHCRRCDDV